MLIVTQPLCSLLMFLAVMLVVNQPIGNKGLGIEGGAEFLA
jgi:hypothetical protein